MLDRLSAFSKKLLSPREPSGDSARRRLQLVLVQDRIGLSPSALDNLKRELLEVVSRHLVIDEASVEVEVRSTGASVVLAANMAVRDLVRADNLSPEGGV
jgi:cell division topological specificity factor